jgi:chromosome segregation ATPase
MLLAGACAHAGAFDRALRAGQWQAAASAFRSDSALQRNAVALRAAARIHADPDSATWDPDRALTLLKQSQARSAPQPLPDADRRLEAMLAYIAGVRAETSARAAALRDSLEQGRVQLAADLAELARLRRANASLDDENSLLQRVAARLEAEGRDREARVAEIQSELDRLKKIDLIRQPVRPQP